MAEREIVIISDLHISEGDLDDCDAELEAHLVSFLDSLTSRGTAAELVINGDFLDFVQASPWSGANLEDRTASDVPLCYTERQSLDKFEGILGDHAAVFQAMRKLLAAHPENRLTVLPGNHDADFFWPRVRAAFTAAVATDESAARLSVYLEPAYQPEGYPWLWIEHGHQYDLVNRFFADGQPCWSEARPPQFRSRLGEVRLYECTGTRFLIRFLNRLDSRYPYVDNVKPFSRFLRIFGASALTPGWGPLEAALAVGGMLRYMAEIGLMHRGDILGITSAEEGGAAHPLAVWFREANQSEQRRLLSGLKERGFETPMPLDMLLERPAEAQKLMEFLAAHSDLLEGLGEKDSRLLGARPGTLTLKAGFTANETEDLASEALKIAGREGVTTVVMGHTHEPVSRTDPITYFNTGSWTRYYQFTQAESTQAWRILREGSYDHFPYHLQYVRVKPGASEASIETWRERSKP